MIILAKIEAKNAYDAYYAYDAELGKRNPEPHRRISHTPASQFFIVLPQFSMTVISAN